MNKRKKSFKLGHWVIEISEIMLDIGTTRRVTITNDICRVSYIFDESDIDLFVTRGDKFNKLSLSDQDALLDI